MKKKQIEDAEDAEIVNSEESELRSKFSPKIRSAGLVLCIFIISVCLVLSGFTYQDKKFSQGLIELQDIMEQSSVSVETMDKKISDFELSFKEQNITQLDKIIVDLENSFNSKIEDIADLKADGDSIGLVKDDLFNFKMKTQKEISQLKLLGLNKVNIDDLSLADDPEVRKLLNSLQSDLDSKIDGLVTRLRDIEEKVSKIGSNRSESLSVDNLNRNFEIDFQLLTELKKSFPEIAHEVLRLEARRDVGVKPLSGFFVILKSLFIFRSTSPREGDDPDAILSRAEYYLNNGNFEYCLQELNNLEEEAAYLFTDWKEKLKTIKTIAE